MYTRCAVGTRSETSLPAGCIGQLTITLRSAASLLKPGQDSHRAVYQVRHTSALRQAQLTQLTLSLCMRWLYHTHTSLTDVSLQCCCEA